MRKSFVLDAGVLALYFAGREDARKYVEAAYERGYAVYVCEVNLAEFLYSYARVFGWEAALARNALVRRSPVKVVGVDEQLTLEAAALKLKHWQKLSLADCYLLALAKRLNAAVVTTDSNVAYAREAPAVRLPI
ncbi:MAG: type II toxin-antitoxin system VapC family toxin [Thermofilum sp.]